MLELTQWLGEVDACVRTRWSLQVGDPTLVGWATTTVYGLAALSCLAAALETGDPNRPQKQKIRYRLFWTFLLVLLTFLAFNKQMDLQSLLTATGRCVAIDMGWFDYRRNVQAFFFLGLAVGAGFLIVIAVIYFRTIVLTNIWAVIGFLTVVAFILLNAAVSTHVIAMKIDEDTLEAGFTAMEILGAGLILISSWNR